jgi:hypothetical protein
VCLCIYVCGVGDTYGSDGRADDSDVSESDTSESDVSESDVSESDVSKSDTSESDTSESDTSESDMSESDMSESDVSESDVSESDTSNSSVTVRPPSKACDDLGLSIVTGYLLAAALLLPTSYKHTHTHIHTSLLPIYKHIHQLTTTPSNSEPHPPAHNRTLQLRTTPSPHPLAHLYFAQWVRPKASGTKQP